MTSCEQRTTQAADLAEWIVDEISEADQDWHAIQLRARELVELLAGLTPPTVRERNPRRQRAHGPRARPR